MADISAMAHREMTVKQKVINSIAIFAGIGVILALMSLFNVGAWVPFLTLVLWAAQGLKFSVKDVLSQYTGIFVGLLMGFLVQNSSTLGTWAIVVFGVLVVLLFLVMINRIKPLDFVFNNYTAAFCTVGTALAYGTEIAVDFAFTFILFGLLPLAVLGIIKTVKKSKTPKAKDAE